MSYFRRYYEAADDSGAEPVEAEETTGGDDVAAETPVAEPETYTREQLAEAFGPHWERFATHEGLDAVRQAGQSYSEAVSLIGKGAHLEPQDPSVYERFGVEPPPPPPAEEHYQEPAIWNAPWIEPNEWEAINQLANSDQVEHKQRAAHAILKSEAPEDYKQAYWDNAYGQGNYQALVYQQQTLLAKQQEMREELKAELREELRPIYQDYETRSSTDLMEAVKAQVPGFVEHAKGVLMIWDENAARVPGYHEWFLKASRPEQLKEMRRLTVIAASEAAPVRQAAQQQATEETDAAKRRAQTETSRTSGQPDTEQSAAKRKSLEDARRVGHRVF